MGLMLILDKTKFIATTTVCQKSEILMTRRFGLKALMLTLYMCKVCGYIGEIDYKWLIKYELLLLRTYII
jgi:hypothetical protein